MCALVQVYIAKEEKRIIALCPTSFVCKQQRKNSSIKAEA